MNDTAFLLALVAAMFGLLTAVLGWVGSKAYSKLESLHVTMSSIKYDLHKEITDIKQRLTAVETRCNIEHTRRD